ncbi:MAG TPA: DUF6600 domain-containing protein [Candidatus Angelobacter sp.]
MTKTSYKLSLLFSLLFMTLGFAAQNAVADDDDPPGRVARLSYTHGAVSFQPGGTDDWVSAVVNRPMTTGDKLWSDDGARAELHIGSASIRLAENTGFSFLDLNDEVTQIRLTAGTLRVRVKRLSENETFEVDTPNLAFSILRPGIYRIGVNEKGDTTIIRVRGGEGEVTGGGSAYTVHAHEIGTFIGTDQLTADVDRFGNDDDDFDAWCAQRDRHEDLSISARYVSPDVIGYEDLDDYGGWRPIAGYGTVWFPHTTVVGWAPYRFGHWAYVWPWGYTWIDDAPWGFAPFHYGRWVFVGGAWGWVPCPPPAPGVVYVRPVYAPALVAWVGGPHFAFGFSSGGFAAGVNVGWFPLGPREVYVPSYPVSRRYVNNVNISNTTVNTTVINNYYNNVVVNKNVTVVHQTYINQSIPGAVTATTPQAFTSAQPVARNVVRVNQQEIVGAPVNAVAPAAAPGKQAVLGTGNVAAVKPPNFVQNRAVVAKVTPPPPPVPFARQQQAIQANGGKPLAISQVRQLEPQNAAVVHPNVKIAPATTNANPIINRGNVYGQNQNNNAGNQGQGSNAGQTGTQGNAGNQGGYRKFNDRPSTGNNQGQSQNTGTQGNAGQPGGGGNPGNQNAYRKFDDRPPSSRPGGNGAGNNAVNSGGSANNPGLDAHHQQQLEQLHVKQDQERQKLEQQQIQEQQKLAQKNADDTRKQQLNQKHEQQLQHLEEKHDNQQQKLQQKQQQEVKKNSN